jgi:anti-sigma regulatory factor (Ser/Thr protein kinase)
LRELALHLLDIANNSVSAHARNITIIVIEDIPSDRLYLSVEDDGDGMDSEMIQRVTDPFVTSRTTRKVGLGIPLLKAAAEACQGYLKIHSQVGKGTQVEVEFQHSHIDRMPLGSISETILALVVGCPEIHWRLIYRYNQETFEFDDQVIKQELGGIPLTEPSILEFLREYLQQGIDQLQAKAETISNQS